MRAIWMVVLVGCGSSISAGTSGSTTETSTSTTATDTETETTSTTETTSATGTGTGLGTGTGSTVTTVDCAEGPEDPEALWDAHFSDLYDPITDVPYGFDASVDAIIGAASLLPDGETLEGLDLLVDSAVVTNVGPRSADATDLSLWFADNSGHMRTYRTSLGGLEQDVQRGDRVRFRVNTVTNYGGELEVTRVSDFSVEPGVEAVYFLDADDTVLDYPTHGRMNVRTWGEVTSAGTACGDASCFDLELVTGQTVLLRVTEDADVAQGDCVYWAGPVGTFDGDLQLDADEPGWLATF